MLSTYRKLNIFLCFILGFIYLPQFFATKIGTRPFALKVDSQKKEKVNQCLERSVESETLLNTVMFACFYSDSSVQLIEFLRKGMYSTVNLRSKTFFYK